MVTALSCTPACPNCIHGRCHFNEDVCLCDAGFFGRNCDQNCKVKNNESEHYFVVTYRWLQYVSIKRVLQNKLSTSYISQLTIVVVSILFILRSNSLYADINNIMSYQEYFYNWLNCCVIPMSAGIGVWTRLYIPVWPVCP